MIYGLVSGTTETLRDAVLDEIDRDPALRAWQIGVTAEDGVVTLTGTVESHAERVAAERASRRVEGVRTVANDLRIRARDERTDTDIARDAAHRLRNNIAVPETVQAVVGEEVRGCHVARVLPGGHREVGIGDEGCAAVRQPVGVHERKHVVA